MTPCGLFHAEYSDRCPRCKLATTSVRHRRMWGIEPRLKAASVVKADPPMIRAAPCVHLGDEIGAGQRRTRVESPTAMA